MLSIFSLLFLKILLAISGSIAAVRSYELIRALQNNGHEVQCILSKGGEQFVSRLALEAISANTILGPDIFTFPDGDVFSHINISKNADILLIAPASANTIAKIAHGIADDFLQNCLLANAKMKVLLAPAMNENMWNHESTQNNITLLQKRGIRIIPPQKNGKLACGDFGIGKMASIETIVSHVAKSKIFQKYSGKKVLLSLGGTQEYIDSVRFIGNASSGKTGYAIAKALFEMGAEVSIVAGNHSVVINTDCFSVVSVCTTQEMLSEMQSKLSWADIVVFCAAVADYQPEFFSAVKKEKLKTGEGITLSFLQTPDIAKTLFPEKPQHQQWIGFCLASEALEKKMHEKLEKKGFDVIIGNTEQNLGSNCGKYYILDTNTLFSEFEGEKNEIMKQVFLSLNPSPIL